MLVVSMTNDSPLEDVMDVSAPYTAPVSVFNDWETLSEISIALDKFPALNKAPE